MTKTILLLVFLSCATATLAAAEEPAPGAHRKLACPDAPDQTYDLYLPKAYGEQKEAKFPVLFISGPGGHPGFHKLEPWAERQGVVLVTIDNSKNGEWPPIIAAQKAVTHAAFSTLRLHHCLRFSVGHSGAAWASGILAERCGDDWAGVVFCINSQRTATLKRHVACAYIAGTKDTTYPIHLVREDMAKAKAAGNPVRIIERETGHTDMASEDIAEMLDWMLELGRVTHPRLTSSERQEGLVRLKERMAAVKTLGDERSRLAAARLLLAIDGVPQLPESKELEECWITALMATTDDAANPIAAHRTLNEAALSPWLAGVSSGSRRSLEARLSALRGTAAVKADLESRQALEQAKLQEAHAGTSRALIQNALAQYAAIARKWPESEAGAAAKAAAERLAGKAK